MLKSMDDVRVLGRSTYLIKHLGNLAEHRVASEVRGTISQSKASAVMGKRIRGGTD